MSRNSYQSSLFGGLWCFIKMFFTRHFCLYSGTNIMKSCHHEAKNQCEREKPHCFNKNNIIPHEQIRLLELR